MCVYCSYVQVARSYVRRDIVWGQEPRARVAVDRHLRPSEDPPLVFGASNRFECNRWTEQVVAKLKVVFSSALDVFFFAYKLSGFVLPW